MSRTNLRIALAGLLCLAVVTGLAACGSSGDDAATKVNVSLVDAGCTPDSIKLTSGPVTFKVSNDGTSKVSEMEVKDPDGTIIGEVENVVEGVPGDFTLTLEPGDYVVNCPNGDTSDQGTISVTGKQVPTSGEGGASAVVLKKATDGYRAYIEAKTRELQAGVAEFAAALRAGDVQRAKELYGPVRRNYEAIEPVAESFGNLDPRIDARINDVASPKQWSGFHRIEKTLWVANTTKGTEPYAKQLVADVDALAAKEKTIQLQPAQLANGAVELLNEVANSKITGEEDRYSHTDLSDFAGNLEGSKTAYDLLVPALVQSGNKSLAETIEERFAAVQKGLDAYKRKTALGYALYDELTPADKRKLAQDIDALAEPLSTVAITVIGGN